MKLFSPRLLAWFGGLAAFGILISFVATSAQAIQDRQTVAELTARMKTACVGRFLIDVPADAKVDMSGAFVGGFNLASTPESDQEYGRRIRSTLDEIAAESKGKGQHGPEWTKALSSDTAKGEVWVSNRSRAQTLEGGRIADVDEFTVRGLLRFPGLSIGGETRRQAYERGEQFARLLQQVRPLREGELPLERGFCIGHALVLDPYEHPDTESVVMFAGLPGHPDIHIVLSSLAGTAPAPGLLERHARAAEREPFYMRLAFTTLREGRRILNGLSGEELALRVRETNFTTGYSFQWQMAGKKDDIHAPLLTLELESGTTPVNGGKPVQSTLSEEAMLELWERIAMTVRLRPTKVVQAAVPDPLTTR